jgi:hypothetical protein
MQAAYQIVDRESKHSSRVLVVLHALVRPGSPSVQLAVTRPRWWEVQAAPIAVPPRSARRALGAQDCAGRLRGSSS